MGLPLSVRLVPIEELKLQTGNDIECSLYTHIYVYATRMCGADWVFILNVVMLLLLLNVAAAIATAIDQLLAFNCALIQTHTHFFAAIMMKVNKDVRSIISAGITFPLIYIPLKWK